MASLPVTLRLAALGARKRLSGLEREKEKLLAQMRQAVGFDNAVGVLIKELDRVEEQRSRCERELARKLPDVSLDLTPEGIISRLEGFVADLRETISVDDADAVRARDLLRDMIDRIVVHPDGPANGTGAGDVRLVVEGDLTRVFELVGTKVGRVTLQEHCPQTLLRNAISHFSYPIDFKYKSDRAAAASIRSDILRLLESAKTPLTYRQVFAAPAGNEVLSAKDAAALKNRIQQALRWLSGQGKARFIRRRGKCAWAATCASHDGDADRYSLVLPAGRLSRLPALRIVSPKSHAMVFDYHPLRLPAGLLFAA